MKIVLPLTGEDIVERRIDTIGAKYANPGRRATPKNRERKIAWWRMRATSPRELETQSVACGQVFERDPGVRY